MDGPTSPDGHSPGGGGGQRFDSVGKMEMMRQQYESQIESLMNQVHSAFEREQKHRLYTKSIEEAYTHLETENMKLKKDIFETNKVVSEIMQKTSAIGVSSHLPPLTNGIHPMGSSKLSSSPLSISQSIPPPPASLISSVLTTPPTTKKTKNGDEALVAEALGSIVELSGSSSSKVDARKPMLKRSNSEDSFRNSPKVQPSSLNFLLMRQSTEPGSNSLLPPDWSIRMESDTSSLSSSSETKTKRRRSESKKNESSSNSSNSALTPSIFITNNCHSPAVKLEQQQQQQQQNPFEGSIGSSSELSSPISHLHTSFISAAAPPKKGKRSSSTGQFPSSMQSIGMIPELDNDVDSADEFDFNRVAGSSGGLSRSGGDAGSPDSSAQSRSSSSPIDTPMSDNFSLFRSIASSSHNTPHEQLLNDIHHLQHGKKECLEKMHVTQKQLLTSDGASSHDDIVMTLQSEQRKLAAQIESEIHALNQLSCQTILESNQLCKLDLLLHDLNIQQKQLQLYQHELTYGSSPDAVPVALVITKQPFPMVISKFKQLQEDHLSVRLLTGTNVELISHSPVRAEMIFHPKALAKGGASPPIIGSTSGNGQKKQMEKDTQTLDPIKHTAKFPIKFLTGTRKGCVKLQFLMQVKTSDGTIVNVPSATSQPFIVITNDCQWEGSEGTLLKKESFNDKFEIAWPHFVNILQKHFLKATKQSPIQPTRQLSLYDFSYLNATFFGNRAFVSHKDFDQFWTWFGKSLQTLRYKRHISTLWQNGLIFMFLRRENVGSVLKGQEAGTFVILFSETFPGQLEISYVSNERGPGEQGPPELKIKHYLVQPNDTSGSKRTLPDFLNECPQFSHILQLNVSALSQCTEHSVPPFRRENKNSILEPYYSKRQNSQNILGSGYEPLLS
ncbi:hypothetical protein SAMD00019534_021230 [Acytostelium subglobosum LB1]|uniref:hypothetical protein n=1 Tax=Acytostelium subglobosum LB1 TaxID=1410327 RepID=UPI000644899A|nr:hypothetical protein SAMD00019534_021230 [Acytostelium subglobosum LB1]GAM18948.1 hypothetical protein SAMD00019534_021230 [Acytostelium subglobosum LB1]|eukprot:XP_012758168.1 hypothetical protein SAMD00019534_021230 [Acytostelium subglobosum LB1]